MQTLYLVPRNAELNTVECLELDTRAQLEIFQTCDKAIQKLQRLKLHNLNPHVWFFDLPMGLETPALLDLEIKGFDLDTFRPDFVFKAKKLRRLVLKNCKLSEFPDFILHCEDLEELDLSYNRFIELPDALFQLPKLRRLGFGNQVSDKFPVWGLNTDAQKRLLSQIAQNAQLQHLQLATYPCLPQDFQAQDFAHLETLQILAAYTSWDFSPTDNLKNASDASTLLYKNLIDESKPEIITEWFARLSQCPRLKNLDIFRINLPAEALAILTTAQSLRTLRLQKSNYPESQTYQNADWSAFKQLNTLFLHYRSDSFPPLLREMPSLESLILEEFNIKNINLPKTFPQLTCIDFRTVSKYGRVFETVTDDFLRLVPQLQQFGIDDLPNNLTIKLLKDLKTLSADYLDDIQHILDLITGSNLEALTNEQLLKCLLIRPAQVNLRAWEVLVQRLDTPEKLASLEKIQKYALIGTATQAADFKKLLATQNWKLSKKMDEAELIILCPTLKSLPAEAPNWSKTLTEQSLRVWLEAQQGFERLDTDSNQNLLQFLSSPEKENILLGLDLITKTYSSDACVDACLMGLALFSPDKEIKEKTKKFISKNWSAELLQTYKANNRRGHEEECYQNVLKSQLVDAKTFANVCVFTTTNAGGYSYRGFGQTEMLELGGAATPIALRRAFASSYGIEINEKVKDLHPDFLKALEENDQFKEIRLYAPTLNVQEKLFTLRPRQAIQTLDFYNYHSAPYRLSDEIGKLRTLKRLRIDSPEDYFPESIAQFTELQELTFADKTAQKLPNVFAALKSLRQLRFFTQNIQQIPDWFGEWTNVKELVWHNTYGFSLAGLLKLKSLKELLFSQKEAHHTDWAGIKPDVYFPNAERIDLQIQSATMEIANQTFKHLIGACGERLDSFNYYDQHLSQIFDFWENTSKKLTWLRLSGSFSNLPAPKSRVEITHLYLFSPNLESLDFDWTLFPRLNTIRLLKESPISATLRKSVPKHIFIEYSTP